MFVYLQIRTKLGKEDSQNFAQNFKQLESSDAK